MQLKILTLNLFIENRSTKLPDITTKLRTFQSIIRNRINEMLKVGSKLLSSRPTKEFNKILRTIKQHFVEYSAQIKEAFKTDRSKAYYICK